MKNNFCITFFCIFIFFIMSSICILAQSQTCSIETIDYLQQLSRLDLFLPEQHYIDQITINTDFCACDDLKETLGLISHSFINSDDLKRSVFYIAQKNKFKTITFILDTNHLIIHLESLWTFDRLKIHGIWLGKAQYARRYLLKPGDPFDDEMHHYSIELLKNICRDEGYLEAQISNDCFYEASNKSVQVSLAIQRGKRFTIRCIHVQCNQEKIKDFACEYFKSLSKSMYSRAKIEQLVEDAHKIFLQKNFYVRNCSFKIQKNSDCSVDLFFELDLSAERRFIFAGNSFFLDQQLSDQLVVFGPGAFNMPASLLADELERHYRLYNFENVTITAQEHEHEVFFTICEGTQKNELHTIKEKCSQQQEPLSEYEYFDYFGKTILQNWSSVPAEYIMRELCYAQGQIWNPHKIRKSIERLQALDIFDSVKLMPISSSLISGEKTMLLSVHADDPHEVRLRLGLGLQQMSRDFLFKSVSYVAGGAFIIKNPLNRADQFRIEADYTHGEQTLSCQYIRPWIFGMPVRGIFEIYATQYLQPGFRHNQKNLYSFIQQGFTVGLNHSRNSTDANINIGIEWMETRVVDRNHFLINKEITRALNFEPLLVDQKIPYILLEPSIVIDRLDNKLNPTKGSLTMLSFKGMFPLRFLSLNSFFAKIYIDQALFFPIKTMVLALRGRAAHIFYHDFKNVMPAERFYLGGANSIRSTETDMCPPLGTIINHHGQTVFVPQGARSLANLNIELRIPLNKNFSAAIFQDLGALSNNHFADIKACDICAGTGWGIRYNTPIGPLRFDIAWKWHRPDSKISRYCWFLSFGNAF